MRYVLKISISCVIINLCFITICNASTAVIDSVQYHAVKKCSTGYMVDRQSIFTWISPNYYSWYVNWNEEPGNYHKEFTGYLNRPESFLFVPTISASVNGYNDRLEIIPCHSILLAVLS